MNKYIVKNCRAYNEPWCGESMANCQDCTDCLLKQVVEICKQRIFISRQHINSDYAGGINMGMILFANEILKLFEIEECE